MRIPLALSACLLVPAGCSDRGEPPAQAEEPAPTTYRRTLGDVLAAELARTGAADAPSQLAATPELRTDRGTLPEDVEAARAAEGDAGGSPAATPFPEVTPEAAALVEGLVEDVVASPRQLTIAQLDLEDGGAAAATALAAALWTEASGPARLGALIDLSSSAPSGEVATALARVGTIAPEAALRARALRALDAQSGAEGADAVLPALLLRLKYEKDPAVLSAIRARTDALRQGLEADGRAPSLALEGQVWRWISDVSGEHFQLRGVDDARFVLSRLGPWAAPSLARALGDRDDYVRLHVCQILERMGTDAAAAAEALVDTLYDDNAGVAGAAAEALVAAVGDGARDPLLRRLDGTPPPGADPTLEAPVAYELKVALARALARLPGDPPAERLASLFEGAPTADLKLAAGEGLLRTERRAAALRWLAAELEASPGAGRDPAGAEDVLERWVLSGDDADLRRDWLASAPPEQRIHTAAEAADRRRARAAVIVEFAERPGN